MQTTLRIDDQLYREAKAMAAREGITLTSFLEDALRMRLKHKPTARRSRQHRFRVYRGNAAVSYAPEQIKRIAEEEQETYDLTRLSARSRLASE